MKTIFYHCRNCQSFFKYLCEDGEAPFTEEGKDIDCICHQCLEAYQEDPTAGLEKRYRTPVWLIAEMEKTKNLTVDEVKAACMESLNSFL